MVAWLLKCNISRLSFMNFNKILQTMWNAYFSCSKQTFYIIRMSIKRKATAGLWYCMDRIVVPGATDRSDRQFFCIFIFRFLF